MVDTSPSSDSNLIIPISPLDVPDIPPNPDVVARWKNYPKEYGSKETLAAKQAYVDYVALGPGRTLKSLADMYQSLSPEEADKAPTQSAATIRMWAEKWQWEKRVEKILDRELKDIEKRDRDRRREILEEGYALMIERVRGLKELAAGIEERLTDSKLSARDGAALIGQLRGVLDDIAKEQGQRRPIVEASTDDGKPTFIIQNNIPKPDWME